MTILSFKVTAIKEEYPGFKTYTFKHDLRARPGQFVMVWMPGVDEVPMSIAWQTEKEFRLGIGNAGDCTAAIHEKIKIGDRLGFRGPFGKSFDLKDYKKIILIGGGTGVPPLLNLAQEAIKNKVGVTVIVGAKTTEKLLYENEFKKLGCKLQIATSDGSKGHHGRATELLKQELEKGKTDCVYTCGPEQMMVSVAKITQSFQIPSQVSLERYMKCGFGICGQCCMDATGFRVCKDGPVVDGKIALQMPEFGKYDRSSSGKRRNL